MTKQELLQKCNKVANTMREAKELASHADVKELLEDERKTLSRLSRNLYAKIWFASLADEPFMAEDDDL